MLLPLKSMTLNPARSHVSAPVKSGKTNYLQWTLGSREAIYQMTSSSFKTEANLLSDPTLTITWALAVITL